MIDKLLATPELSKIAQTIQLSVAPVFLLAGIGQFLNLLAGRLSRIVDRSRRIEAGFTPRSHPRHQHQVWELRLLDRRIRVVNNAIFLAAVSAVLVCLVVAGLFVASLADVRAGRPVAFAFIAAMALLIAALILFLIEVRLASHAVKIKNELLEHDVTAGE
jgi:hypothetical protein